MAKRNSQKKVASASGNSNLFRLFLTYKVKLSFMLSLGQEGRCSLRSLFIQISLESVLHLHAEEESDRTALMSTWHRAGVNPPQRSSLAGIFI
ncbi:hypothetical protein AV530_017488 [Patagioenas fasciata monilis]|uniref:Uncharacterized protein n=1 Tax=Patagioenas fasciata monilis TaxID=372326 RepID=A0A1V4JGG2_PATFA|nr:hypothetical protein AV530_017488 [Patagioenas fasciata monilis]